MKPRAIATIMAAILLGLAAGHLVANDYMPWYVPVVLLIVGLIVTVWSIREQVRLAIATRSAKRRSR